MAPKNPASLKRGLIWGLLLVGLCALVPLFLNPYFLFVTLGAGLYLLAFAALGGFACGVYLWRKNRRLSIFFLTVSAAYLAFYLHFFIFHGSNPTHSSVAIDLRRPTDLSGIPEKTVWIGSGWPPPKTVILLSASGSSCETDGNVDLTLTLPDGFVVHQSATRVVIETNNLGIWQILVESFGIKPKAALDQAEATLWPLAMRPENLDRTARARSEIRDSLENFDSKSSLNSGFTLVYPAYRLAFGVRNISVWNPLTFGPANRVIYTYWVTLPHIHN